MKQTIWAIICASALISCGNYSQQATAYQINPNSALAHMLELSSEDIAILSKHHHAIMQKISEKTKLSLDDVINLHLAGLKIDTTLQILRYTKSEFKLNSSDIIRLQAEGVPYKVINYLICT